MTTENRKTPWEVKIDPALTRKVRDCIMHLKGSPDHLNQARFTEEAFHRLLAYYRRRERGRTGNPEFEFPERDWEPPRGRPAGDTERRPRGRAAAAREEVTKGETPNGG